MVRILALDIAGNPFRWMEPEEAIRYYATGKVAWDLGERELVFRGGWNHAGERSEIRTRTIMALAGSDTMVAMQRDSYPLSDRNDLLFRRDRHICAYCGQSFPRSLLTRDHIIPRSRGGQDNWTNCVTACMNCNHDKGALLLSEWGKDLLYVPYVPCRWEHAILSERDIQADQMDYLSAKLPRHSRARI